MVSVEFSLNNYTRSRNENKRKKEAGLKRKKKKTATRTETLIYQWISSAKKAALILWLRDRYLFHNHLRKEGIHIQRIFFKKIEIFGSVNETPVQSKWPKQNKRITDIASNFQEELFRKTFLSKCCTFGLPYTSKFFDKFIYSSVFSKFPLQEIV